jgi:hypothetical protein
MTEVRVTPMEPGAFGVEVEEGRLTTGHRFFVPESFWDERDVADVDDVAAVEAAAQFLLDREPGTAIPAEVSFEELEARYDDFVSEVRDRIGR